MATIGRLNKLGFNERNMDPKVKGVLYHTYFRSSLLYGMENANLTSNDILMLTRLEGKIIKHSYGINKYCYTQPLLDLMNIASVEFLIKEKGTNFPKAVAN